MSVRDSDWVPERPIDGEAAAVETAGGLGCRVGTAAAVAAGEVVAPRHRQRGSRLMESNRRFEGVLDAEADRIVDELGPLGWRNGMCQVPVGCHMSIAGDDGRDPKREELGFPRRSGCEGRWGDNEAVVERAVGWIGRRRRKGAVRSGAGFGFVCGGPMGLACNICRGGVGLKGLGVGIHQNRTHIVVVLDGHTEAVLAVTLMLPIATHNPFEP